MTAVYDSAAPASGAVLSPCGTYRYHLWRRWGAGAPLVFCMLNPSTADATTDDPTVRKCVGFAKRLGFGGIDVVNLYAYRATDPRTLDDAHKRTDTIGPDNGTHLLAAFVRAGKVVCAWGAHKVSRGRLSCVASHAQATGQALYCLGRCEKGGQPRHPLMLAYVTTLEPYEIKL